VNRKILCVDDEEAILRGFKLNLRNQFDLHFASDGKEGLELCGGPIRHADAQHEWIRDATGDKKN
jgi:CheY-like chemotaxis protein